MTAFDVDEVVQEAYARLWAADIEHINNPRAYLFVTARHIVGEALRRSRIVSIELIADIDSLNIADEDCGPERRLGAREEIERLHEILQKIPSRCRRAFELRKFEGLSQKEIAQRMGIAESTVEKHLSKALKLIMQAVTAQSDEGENGWRSMRANERRRKNE